MKRLTVSAILGLGEVAMLLWSLHPKYLDTKGLCGLWFEGIIARNTLMDMGKSYRNHPQLKRFKSHPDPISAIDTYLETVYQEGISRGYHYNRTLFGKVRKPVTMAVTAEQLEYEYGRLLEKLKGRDLKRYEAIKDLKTIEPHPMFQVTASQLQEA